MTRPLVSCSPLDPAQLDAFYAFVEQEAFTDNAHWASCFCVFPYLRDQYEGEWDGRTAAENRALLGQLVTSGRGNWVIASLGGQIVGWVNADLVSRFVRFDTWGQLEDGTTGGIHCFVVHPRLRRQGIAGQLLNAAVDRLRDLGCDYAEAWVVSDPGAAVRPPLAWEQAAFSGPLSMYLQAGFEVVERDGDDCRVRRILAG